MKHPHPNVATYHGWVVEGGRIVGLAFTKYNLTLCQRWKTLPPLKKEKTLKGIENGIRHLHSLGYVHNDIDIENVMFGDDDVPVINDFDWCWKEGEGRGMKGETHNWYDEKYEHENSRRENYFSGLRRI